MIFALFSPVPQEERKSNEAAEGAEGDSDEQFRLMQALVIDKLQEDTKINNKEKGKLIGQSINQFINQSINRAIN